MKRSVTVNVNAEKHSPIEMYLDQKRTTLAAELDRSIERRDRQVVPQNVRNFIDMKSMKKPARKTRNTLLPESEKNPEQ